MKIISEHIVTVLGCGAELLDLVLGTCNYEASGDGCVLVDTDQLENTQDMSGKVGKLLETIINSSRQQDYTGFILLRN
jgi:hypothetical protein